MLVIPDVEKWQNDKDFYNKKYVSWIKQSWIYEINSYNKKLVKVKKQDIKDKYLGWIEGAQDNLFKLDIILENLK